MKRQVRITSFILLLSILLYSLISCGGKNSAFEKMDDREKAKYIVEKTDEYYEKSIEQQATLSCEIEGEVNGIAIKMEIDGTSERTVTNAKTDKMRYVSVSKMKSVTRTGTEKETENYTETSAFIDGYMYMGYDTDKKDGKDVYLKSALSAADFYDFLESSGIKSDEPEYSQICDNVAVTLSDDGKTYNVKITHGAENVKEELTKVTNELTASFGIKFALVSFELEYTVDAKKLIITEVRSKYVTETPKFGNDVLRLTCESVISSSAPQAGEPTLDGIENYTQTGDLRYTHFLSNRLNGLISADSVGYTLTSNSKMSGNGIELSTSEETDVINCGYKDGIYVYSIDAKANFEGQKIDMSVIYNGAQQKIAVSGGTSQSTDTNEIVARMYLINILNLVLISPNDVTSVEVKNTEGDVTTVEFELAFGERYINRIKAAVPSDKISNAYARVTAEFDKDMNVINVSLTMSADSAYAGYTYTIKGDTLIKDFRDGDVSGVTAVKPGSSDL